MLVQQEARSRFWFTLLPLRKYQLSLSLEKVHLLIWYHLHIPKHSICLRTSIIHHFLVASTTTVGITPPDKENRDQKDTRKGDPTKVFGRIVATAGRRRHLFTRWSLRPSWECPLWRRSRDEGIRFGHRISKGRRHGCSWRCSWKRGSRRLHRIRFRHRSSPGRLRGSRRSYRCSWRCSWKRGSRRSQRSSAGKRWKSGSRWRESGRLVAHYCAFNVWIL
jgi:hypothetical protein